MVDEAGTPLPESVAVKLRALEQQMAAIQAAQRQYLQGVMDVLGIQGKVKVDFATMTYRVLDDTPGFREHPE